ncbi:MAG TPA: hypothetical protein VLL25_14725 [Acidimicrobiales bacterium]|nr:hypothetical protein [Acidimicrobiales bacterium]
MKQAFHLERPNPARLVLAVAYALATTGLVVIAFDSLLYNQWATFGLAVLTLMTLAAILLTGYGVGWLVVGGLWVYAAVIATIRSTDPYEQAGLGLIFTALAIGALAAYIAYDRNIV